MLRVVIISNSVLCYVILSKTECMIIYYHIKRDHGKSDFRKLIIKNLIFRRNLDYSLD